METNITFLLIEDNLIDQLVIKQLFKKVLNIDQISIVNNGREGLQWINENKNQEALIILLPIVLSENTEMFPFIFSTASFTI